MWRENLLHLLRNRAAGCSQNCCTNISSSCRNTGCTRSFSGAAASDCIQIVKWTARARCLSDGFRTTCILKHLMDSIAAQKRCTTPESGRRT